MVWLAANVAALLATPLAVTTTGPGPGAGHVIDVAPHVVGVAVQPLNVTVPVPCVEPKPVPVIVTSVPTVPEVGDRLVMIGVGANVNGEPLLATPFTVTTRLPVVAPVGTTATIVPVLQLVIEVAVVPLNVTVLVPCVEPKFDPIIVSDAPTAPEGGDRYAMFGVGNTVNPTVLLFTPLA